MIKQDSVKAMEAREQLRQAHLVHYPGTPLAFGPRYNGRQVVLPSVWDRAPMAPFIFAFQHHYDVVLQDENEVEDDIGDEIVAHCYRVHLQERPDGKGFDPHLTLLQSYALDKQFTGYRHWNNGPFEYLANGKLGFVVDEIPVPEKDPPAKARISICSLDSRQERGPSGLTSSIRLTTAACCESDNYELGICLASGRLAYVATVESMGIPNNGNENGLRTECVVCDFLWDE